MVRTVAMAALLLAITGCSALSKIPDKCDEVPEDERPTVVDTHDLCANYSGAEVVNPVTGTFRWEYAGEVRGPWAVGIDFLTAGQQVELAGCHRGAYGMCWTGDLILDIGQRVEDEPLALELGAGLRGVAAEQWTDTEVWFLDAPATGTATVTRYTPDEGRLTATVEIEPVDHDDAPLESLFIDIDVEFTP